MIICRRLDVNVTAMMMLQMMIVPYRNMLIVAPTKHKLAITLKYSRTSVARTLMARLSRLFRTRL